ncbi:MAG: hypothetical protein QOF53_3973 [Nocardioidaceae bacterium]|jgi:hypothetical protein|nr:hypothetical protein [Nocardioidaceae bacterium]
MHKHVESRADRLMLTGVSAPCTDCGDERILVPVDHFGSEGEFCCTSCDAAVFLVAVPGPARRRRATRVA